MNTKPLNNNCLIEVILEDDGVSRMDENEPMRHGILIEWSISNYHLTASSAIEFSDEFMSAQSKLLESMLGNIVRWEEYAEGGQTFEENNKTYALIPWWRLISEKENN